MRYKSVLLLTALLATLCPPEGSTALRSGWSGGGWHQGLTSSSSPGGRWCHKCFPVLLVGEHPSWSDTYIIDSESIEGPETSLLHWFPCGELCPEIFRSELTWGAPLCEKKKPRKLPFEGNEPGTTWLDSWVKIEKVQVTMIWFSYLSFEILYFKFLL